MSNKEKKEIEETKLPTLECEHECAPDPIPSFKDANKDPFTFSWNIFQYVSKNNIIFWSAVQSLITSAFFGSSSLAYVGLCCLVLSILYRFKLLS